jgi:hypothetical protein
VRPMINRDFSQFVIIGERGDDQFDNRYHPDVADAMALAYPKRVILGEFVVVQPDAVPMMQSVNQGVVAAYVGTSTNA